MGNFHWRIESRAADEVRSEVAAAAAAAECAEAFSGYYLVNNGAFD